jgi:hypothetical protein
MTLLKGKHIVKEIAGELCTIVESGVSTERITFLQSLLEFNKFEVKVEEDKTDEGTSRVYTIGVTDLVFNPMIAVYEKSLKRPGGGEVSPAYWYQQSEISMLPYYDYRKKNPDAVNEDEFIPVSHNYSTV